MSKTILLYILINIFFQTLLYKDRQNSQEKGDYSAVIFFTACFIAKTSLVENRLFLNRCLERLKRLLENSPPYLFFFFKCL